MCEGIRLAQAAGKYKGRSKKLTEEQVAEARRLVQTGVSKAAVARGLGIDCATLYRAPVANLTE